MLNGDDNSAIVVTPKTIYETKNDRSVLMKQVWEALNTPTAQDSIIEKKAQTPPFTYEPFNHHSPPPDRTETHRVSR